MVHLQNHRMEINSNALRAGNWSLLVTVLAARPVCYQSSHLATSLQFVPVLPLLHFSNIG